MKNSHTTFVIAEAGANHNKSFEQATALIDVAVAAKADAVKFQTYSAETLYSIYTPDFGGYNNISQLIKDIELPREWQADLKSYCDDAGIEFMSTPFDEKAVDELYNLGVKRLKIAGFESTDPRLVKCVASTQLPLVITAGIGSNVAMVGNILNWVRDVNPDADVTILHGNNAYPTPFDQIGLGQIGVIKKAYPNVKVGLSDHTPGIFIPPLAVAHGATTIEKHYTLSRHLPGPDHPFAIEPMELKAMVANIRLAETTGNTRDRPFTRSEEGFRKAMRSVVATASLKKGETLTTANITTKRPCLEGSIPAIEYYNVMGSTVIRDIEQDAIITYEDIKAS
jgi:sialic acid synthase SpsE